MAFDKVIDSAKLDAGMTATANAIREKTGGNAPIVWDEANGFKNAVEGIQTGGGGDNELLHSILDRSISGEFSDNELTWVGNYAFYKCDNLTKVVLPKVVGLNQYAFSSCSNLEEVYLPEYT